MPGQWGDFVVETRKEAGDQEARGPRLASPSRTHKLTEWKLRNLVVARALPFTILEATRHVDKEEGRGGQARCAVAVAALLLARACVRSEGPAVRTRGTFRQRPHPTRPVHATFPGC